MNERKESLSGRINPSMCAHCKREATLEGHDACLGTLPGVWNACCGHGVPHTAYVQFEPGPVRDLLVRIGLVEPRQLDGVPAIKWMIENKPRNENGPN